MTSTVAEIAEQIAGTLDELSSSSAGMRERGERLVRQLAELYGNGLRRMTTLLADEEGGHQRLVRLAQDEVVAGLLVLHDLHPIDLHTRVTTALEQVRPYLGSHAGGVTLLSVDQGIVRLRLEGSCDGCPASTITVKTAIEGAITAACPEIEAVVVDGVTDQVAVAAEAPPETPMPGLHQIQRMPRAEGPTATLPDAGDLSWTTMQDVDGSERVSTRTVEGVAVLLCLLDGDVNAYHDRCARCGGSLAAGLLDGEVLACPACAATFDVRRAGRGTDPGEGSLVPLPVLRGPDGGLRIAVPAGAVV